ncbi:hypothetical protein M0R45_027569 [Rubus argutus]|uniref:Uncharacterized protein n=1 Tax=Rubus argutus TaxID=59490 RepID=A0AAW1X0P7_RUBAR
MIKEEEETRGRSFLMRRIRERQNLSKTEKLNRKEIKFKTTWVSNKRAVPPSLVLLHSNCPLRPSHYEDDQVVQVHHDDQVVQVYHDEQQCRNNNWNLTRALKKRKNYNKKIDQQQLLPTPSDSHEPPHLLGDDDLMVYGHRDFDIPLDTAYLQSDEFNGLCNDEDQPSALQWWDSDDQYQYFDIL